jgi:Esterase-like activity of phytase/Bacterial Ig domain
MSYPNTKIVALGAAAAVLAIGTGAAAGTRHGSGARADSYRVRQHSTLAVGGRGVFANDPASLTTVVRNTAPAHGSLTLQPNGTFSYTPTAGFRGTDSFQYTTSDAVDLYRTHLPPLATGGGVPVTAGGYGSSLARVPGSNNEYYGLTDRGPNVDGPNGTKVEPLPDFTPAIGKFRLRDGNATLLRKIDLHAADGTPYNGRVNCQAGTGETITDGNGTVLPCSDTGYDSEGLVALPDGTFWVSDEYGPFITHFDHDGRQIGRLSPFDHSLPRELANRVPNKGMEGLTVTPNGRMLVGMMQSALQQPDLTKKPANVAPLRIVTIDLKTYAMHEYVYLLHDPKTNSGAVSEISAVSNTSFLVDERDGNFEPNAYKKLFRIDLSGATDVGPQAAVPDATYDATHGGLLIGTGKQTIEGYTQNDTTTSAAAADLAAAHITPVTTSLAVDVGGLLTGLDPTGGLFGHDKIEGVAPLDGGRTVVLSNDSDFGIDGVAQDTAPFGVHPKILPNGQQDDGEFLAIRTDRLPATTSTATVTITVR